MVASLKTSQEGKGVIKFFEGCARRLPNGNLISYRPSRDDNPTIGWGCEGYLFPGTPGQIKIVDGLIITQQQADDAFDFFLVNVVEPLVNAHFNPETQGEFDALVSWCWNIRHDRLNRGDYSLPEIFNRKPRDADAIVEWWIKYVNPKTMVEQGLYRRRLAELCLMFGWPWRFATTAVLKRVNGIIEERTDPAYILNLAEAAAEKAAEKAPEPVPAPVAPNPPVAAKPPPAATPEPKAAPKPVPAKKPVSPNTKTPAQVGLDPNAGLKHVSESDRAKGWMLQHFGLMLLRLSTLGMFGNGAAIVANTIQADATLMTAAFELAIPLALNGGTLVTSYVIYWFGRWKEDRGREVGSQALYV